MDKEAFEFQSLEKLAKLTMNSKSGVAYFEREKKLLYGKYKVTKNKEGQYRLEHAGPF